MAETYYVQRARELGLPKGTGKRYSSKDILAFIKASEIRLPTPQEELIDSLELHAGLYDYFPLDEERIDSLVQSFDGPAKRALATSQTEARKQFSPNISVNRLLLGILRHSSPIRKVFEEYGATFRTVVMNSPFSTYTGFAGFEVDPTPEKPDLSEVARVVVAVADVYRSRFNEQFISTDSLVAGIAAQNLVINRSKRFVFDLKQAEVIQSAGINPHVLLARIIGDKKSTPSLTESTKENDKKSALEILLYAHFGTLNIDPRAYLDHIEKLKSSAKWVTEYDIEREAQELAWVIQYNGKVPGNWHDESDISQTFQLAKNFGVQFSEGLTNAALVHPNPFLIVDTWHSQRLVSRQMVTSAARIHGEILSKFYDLEGMIAAQVQMENRDQLKLAANSSPIIREVYSTKYIPALNTYTYQDYPL